MALGNDGHEAIRDAIDRLAPYGADVRVADVIEGMRAISPSEDFSGADEDAVTKSLMKCEHLLKEDDLPPALRARTEDTLSKLQLEHLGRSNPAAARAYEEARAA